jgi:hypothetical protein
MPSCTATNASGSAGTSASAKGSGERPWSVASATRRSARNSARVPVPEKCPRASETNAYTRSIKLIAVRSESTSHARPSPAWPGYGSRSACTAGGRK